MWHVSNMLDATLCISLARRPDRWALFKSHAEAIGLQAEKFEAVDGSTFPAFTTLPEKFRGYEGALGCAWSHWRIAQLMLVAGWNAVLVLEDDARFQAPPAVALSYVNSALAAGAVQVHLGLGGSCREAELVGRGPGFFEVRRMVNTHAYVMTRELAAALDQAMTENPFRSDWRIHVDRLFHDLLEGKKVTAPFEELVSQDKSVESDVQWSFPDKVA